MLWETPTVKLILFGEFKKMLEFPAGFGTIKGGSNFFAPFVEYRRKSLLYFAVVGFPETVEELTSTIFKRYQEIIGRDS